MINYSPYGCSAGAWCLLSLLLFSPLDLLSELSKSVDSHTRYFVPHLNARHFIRHSRINFDAELDIIEDDINQNH